MGLVGGEKYFEPSLAPLIHRKIERGKMKVATINKVLLFSLISFISLSYSELAKADAWKTIGSDKDAFGQDMRILEINLDSVKRSKAEISVGTRISTHSISRVGYNCNEGEIRHGNTKKRLPSWFATNPVPLIHLAIMKLTGISSVQTNQLTMKNLNCLT